MSNDEMQSLDDAAIVKMLAEKQFSVVRARFAHSMGRLEDTASLATLRKDVARVKTELRRREVAAGLSKDELARRHGLDSIRPGSASEAAPAGGLLSGVVDRLGG